MLFQQCQSTEGSRPILIQVHCPGLPPTPLIAEWWHHMPYPPIAYFTYNVLNLASTGNTVSQWKVATKTNKLHRLTEWDSRLAHYFAVLGVWGYILGYLATSGIKSDVIFLLATPISYKGDNISHLSRLVIEIPILGYLGVFGVLGVFSYLRCKIWHHILARWPRFPKRATKFRAYFASFSRSPFRGIWGFGATFGVFS